MTADSITSRTLKYTQMSSIDQSYLPKAKMIIICTLRNEQNITTTLVQDSSMKLIITSKIGVDF